MSGRSGSPPGYVREARSDFTDAWGFPHSMNRDLSGMPTAVEVYGGKQVDDIEHVRVHEATDSNGQPYIYHNVLLKLMVRLYGEVLNEYNQNRGRSDNREIKKRFNKAKDQALNSKIDSTGVDTVISGNDPVETISRDGHAYILERTKQKLL